MNAMTKPVGRNFLHWIAIAVAVLCSLGFIMLNHRGIFEWKGIGVYTIPFYVVGVLVACVLWFVGQMKSRSGISLLFWTVLSLPLVLILLLPTMFYV